MSGSCDICHTADVSVAKYKIFQTEESQVLCEICATSHIANVQRRTESYEGRIFPIMYLIARCTHMILKAIKDKK